MPTLEQQLADAIKAQNDLTQAVALYKSQLDAAAQSARDSTRVSSVNGVLRANNLTGGAFYSENIGIVQIRTPIKRTSHCMYWLHIHGYDYGESGKVIDHKIVGYAYGDATGPDGKKGNHHSVGAQRSGTTGKTKIFIGFDSNDNLNILFGAPKSWNYYQEFVMDGKFHAAFPSVSPTDYSIFYNNADAPAAGANSGFGLTCLLEL